MPLYPRTAYRLDGWNPLRISAASHIKSLENNVNRRVTSFAGDWQSEASSYPMGTAPYGSIWLPITAGGMSAHADLTLTGTANLLNGGPMQAAGTMTLTAGTPSMGLVVSMSVSGAVVTMTADANLRLTIGMSASGTLEFSGSCNMAMIVPLGNATGSMSLTGAADLRGNLTMSAEWGGAEPLSPEGLARAVWSALATDYNVSGTMGYKLNSASAAGDPWTADPTAYAAGTAGASLVASSKALQLGQFLALK